MTPLGADGAPPSYQVAAIQFEPTLFSKAANLEALLRLTEAAAAGGAKLIVAPEMATTAYCWATGEEIASDVEPVRGVRMRIPISYEALRAPAETAARVARERGARAEAWLTTARETMISGMG
jgi:hypothetical protein